MAAWDVVETEHRKKSGGAWQALELEDARQAFEQAGTALEAIDPQADFNAYRRAFQRTVRAGQRLAATGEPPSEAPEAQRQRLTMGALYRQLAAQGMQPRLASIEEVPGARDLLARQRAFFADPANEGKPLPESLTMV